MLQGKLIRSARKGKTDKRIPWCSIVACLIPAVLTACSIPSVIQTAAEQIYVVALDERPTWTLTQDKQIEVSIEKSFHDEPTVSILHISAYCYNGNVYLVGEYETAEEAMKAITIAGQTAGVKSVTPYLLVKGGTASCGWGDDVFIHAKVKTKFIADGVTKSTNIDIKVVQCRVVLLGILGTGVEVSRAIDLAQEVKGVIEVKSFLIPAHQEGQ
jgi:hyperosmotically inducible periplasmic protein